MSHAIRRATEKAWSPAIFAKRVSVCFYGDQFWLLPRSQNNPHPRQSDGRVALNADGVSFTRRTYNSANRVGESTARVWQGRVAVLKEKTSPSTLSFTVYISIHRTNSHVVYDSLGNTQPNSNYRSSERFLSAAEQTLPLSLRFLFPPLSPERGQSLSDRETRMEV